MKLLEGILCSDRIPSTWLDYLRTMYRRLQQHTKTRVEPVYQRSLEEEEEEEEEEEVKVSYVIGHRRLYTRITSKLAILHFIDRLVTL